MPGIFNPARVYARLDRSPTRAEFPHGDRERHANRQIGIWLRTHRHFTAKPRPWRGSVNPTLHAFTNKTPAPGGLLQDPQLLTLLRERNADTINAAIAATASTA